MELMETFKINDKSKIWIYGYSDNGKKIAEILNKNGCFIRGFFDRNAEKYKNINVFLPREKFDADDIVVLSLQSIISQFTVAENLYKSGCNKILFAAAGKEYEIIQARKMREIYEGLINGCVDKNSDIPCYNCLREKDDINEPWVIKKYKERVVIWCPVELLYTPSPEMIAVETVKRCENEHINHWELDAPVLAVLNDPYDMGIIIRYIQEHKGNPIPHMNNLEKLFRRNMWEHEIAISALWEWEFSRGLDYFMDAPPRCNWNEKGYFNIFDGCHRSVFLVLKDLTSIPISISYDDYNKYIIWGKKYLESDSYLPVLNRYDLWWCNRDYPRILGTILRYCYDNKIIVNNILDCMDNECYYSTELSKWKQAKVFNGLGSDNSAYKTISFDVVLCNLNLSGYENLLKEINWKCGFFQIADEKVDELFSNKDLSYTENIVLYKYYENKTPCSIVCINKGKKSKMI